MYSYQKRKTSPINALEKECETRINRETVKTERWDWTVQDYVDDFHSSNRYKEFRCKPKQPSQGKITEYYGYPQEVDVIVIDDEQSEEDEMYGDVRDIHESPFA